MDLYLAIGEIRMNGTNNNPIGIAKYAEELGMEVYLAGTEQEKGRTCKDIDIINGANILQSFYYANDLTEKIIKRCKNFILDSGAFSFMSGADSNVNWKEYIERYAAFVKKNNVKYYLELDIDSIVGYEKVKEYRAYLESMVGYKCIPVWHKSRGKKEFLKMCDEYDYVAIGGIVTKEITKEEYKYFPWFINEAHKRGAKIHGLGFTNLEGIRKYHFDSVDSTSWVSGNRFGAIYKFNGNTMVKYKKPDGMRVKNKETAINNYLEWRKFCDYAETHL